MTKMKKMTHVFFCFLFFFYRRTFVFIYIVEHSGHMMQALLSYSILCEYFAPFVKKYKNSI